MFSFEILLSGISDATNTINIDTPKIITQLIKPNFMLIVSKKYISPFKIKNFCQLKNFAINTPKI